MIAGALLMIVGTQVLALGLCAHAYGTYFMGDERPVVRPHAGPVPARARPAARGRRSRVAGLVIAAVIVGIWVDRGFGELSEERLAVLAATLIIVGIQVFFSSFLSLDPRAAPPAASAAREADLSRRPATLDRGAARCSPSSRCSPSASLIPRDHYTGTNSVGVRSVVVDLEPGQRLCVSKLDLPDGTGRVRIHVFWQGNDAPPSSAV